MFAHELFALVFESGKTAFHALQKILPFAALTVGELWVKHPLVGASRFGQHLSNIAAATEDLAEALWRKETCIVKTQKLRNAKTIKNINFKQTMTWCRSRS